MVVKFNDDCSGCFFIRNLLSLCLFFTFFDRHTFVSGVAIDNGIVGKPAITCTDEVIQFAFTTQKAFQGRVYVKGRADDSNCREEYTNFNATNATYTIKLGKCGMQRLRSVEPPGTQMMITVIVSFHPIFETKVDKAFRIQCMFAPGGGEQRVTQNLEVSMIPTTPLDAFGGVGGSCTYTIRRGAVDGPPMRFAIIGDKAVHVWECEGTENMSIFVHSCVASDTGSRVNVPIVNEKGCSVDPILLENIQYDPAKTVAFATSHVYKYADQSSIGFVCNVRFCAKGTPECTAITPPSCPVKPVFVDRRRRNSKDSNKTDSLRSKYDRTIDVSSDDLLVLPNINGLTSAVLFDTLNSLAEKSRLNDKLALDKLTNAESSTFDNRYLTDDGFMDQIADAKDVCIPQTTFAVMVTSTLFAFVLSTLIGVVIFAKVATRVWSDRSGSAKNQQKKVHYQKKSDNYKEVFVPYFNSIYR